MVEEIKQQIINIKNKRKTILTYGDSNTWGYNPENKKRYDDDIRYPKILNNILGESYNVIEEGLCGRTTIYQDYRYGRAGIDFIEVLLESHAPDILVLMLGTNDYKIANARSLDDIKFSMEILIEQILKVYSGKIILVSPILLSKNIKDLDPEFDDLSYEISKNASLVYEEIAKKHNFLYLDAKEYATPGVDGEHMTEQGHKQLALALKNLIINNID